MKKHHFDAFRHEKHFEKQLQPYSQTDSSLFRNAYKMFFFKIFIYIYIYVCVLK